MGARNRQGSPGREGKQNSGQAGDGMQLDWLMGLAASQTKPPCPAHISSTCPSQTSTHFPVRTGAGTAGSARIGRFAAKQTNPCPAHSSPNRPIRPTTLLHLAPNGAPQKAPGPSAPHNQIKPSPAQPKSTTGSHRRGDRKKRQDRALRISREVSSRPQASSSYSQQQCSSSHPKGGPQEAPAASAPHQ